MNKYRLSRAKTGLVLCGALAAALTGCTTYVEHRPARVVYVPPPPVAPPPVVVTPVEPPVVVIQAEADFYEPLTPHGEWVVVGSYGRCWRPTRVEVGWRPYADGHWRRTDAGWYWVSDEPWGWATYHYGRWDWSVEFGWFWVPHTLWAPAWVSWRQGAGYVGWAPLPPSARIGARGMIEVRETAIAPRAFVFVSEQRLVEPVHPTTVIVNNTTVINQTVNITQVQMVNQTVINEGPRPEIIERKSGRRLEVVPVRELRRKDETEIAARRRNIPLTSQETVQPPARGETVPGKTIPARDRRPVADTIETSPERQPQATRNEARKPAGERPAPSIVRPEADKPVRNERRPEIQGEKGRVETTPADAEVKRQPEPKPSILPRETQPRPEATQQRQPPARTREPRGAGELNPAVIPARPEAPRTVGNTRQREMERGKMIKPEAGPPSAVRKPTTPPSTRQVEKPPTSAKEKPPVRKRGEVKKKADEKKKGDEQEKPRPTVPPQSPP